MDVLVNGQYVKNLKTLLVLLRYKYAERERVIKRVEKYGETIITVPEVQLKIAMFQEDR